MRTIWALAIGSAVLATAACSSPSGPSQAQIQAEQAHFCSLVTQWIQQNQNIATALPDVQSDMQLSTQMYGDAQQLMQWNAYYPDDIKPTDETVAVTQWEPGYQTAVDALRRYCMDAGIQVPQWGQA